VDLGRAPQRPWLGALWAQSRIEHLEEELALNPNQPELKTEILELALAYNFVTPYTAFLAIPESELGEMRGTVDAARAHKKQSLAENPDAAALHGGGGSTGNTQVAKGDKDRFYVDKKDADDARPKMAKRAHRDSVDGEDDKPRKKRGFSSDDEPSDRASA